MRRAGLLITGVILATGAGLALSSPAASAAGTSVGGSTATAAGSQHGYWRCDPWDRWDRDCDDWGNRHGNRYWHHNRRHHHRWHLWDQGGNHPWTDVRG